MTTSDRTAVSTFDRVAIDLIHEPFPQLAVAILDRTDRILEHWRQLSLKAMPHLDALTLEEFENTIAEILSAVADAVRSANPQKLRGVIERGPGHGIDRFVQKQSLLDLFEEVRILRGVVVLEIAQQLQRPLDVREAATFHAIFDIIIQQAAMALVQKQNEVMLASNATIVEMNERLLVSSVRQNEMAEKAQEAEAAMRESEEQYRTLFDLGPVAIYSCDAAGVIQTFNRRAAELWGREPALGDTDERFCGSFRMLRPDGTFMPHEQCPMAEVLSGKITEVRDAEVLIERPDGSRITVLVNIRPLKNDKGEIRGAINCFSDITQRKAAEKASARLAAIVTSSDDAIISKDLNGVITSWNRGAQNLFGYSDEEIVGRPVTLLIPQDLQDEEPQILARIRRGDVVNHYETVRRRKDGSLVDISLTVSPIRDAAGQIVGASKVARDNTERKRAETTLKEQAQSLADLHRRKDEFLAMLSHELRNPLAPIQNAVHLLRIQRDRSPLQAEAHEMIDRQVAQLARLVDDLLEVSRITTGRIHLQKERVDLRGIVSRAIDASQPQAGHKAQSIAKSLPAEPSYVYGDSVRLEQIIVNLLNNAIKYTDRGGHIWVELKVKGDEAVLRVRDTGVGIAPELLPRIFDLFTQADKSLDRSQGGLGIGLALVQSLVTMHHGRVEAQSSPGQGSEFIVTLPTMLSPDVLPSAAPEVVAAPAGVLRILVVDDNVDTAKSLANLLRAFGHDARLAHDGAGAMQAALHHIPEVVLLDIGLPVVSGYEVAKWIRQEPVLKNVAIIALTGYGQESDRKRTQESGFDHHLVKPVDFDKLESILAAVAEKAQ